MALNLKFRRSTSYHSLAIDISRLSHHITHTCKYSHSLPQWLWFMVGRATDQTDKCGCMLQAKRMLQFFFLMVFFKISKPHDTFSVENSKEIQKV